MDSLPSLILNDMTQEQIEQIFEEANGDWEGDNLVQGLDILRKYFDISKEAIIGSASHDQVCGPDIEELIERGVTEEDINKLAKLNWCVEDEYLILFV